MQRFWWLHVAMCCAFSMLLAFPGQAERRYDVHGDLVSLGADEHTGVLTSVHNASPGNPQRVVINDSTYTVDDQAIFRTAEGSLTSLAQLKPGTPVRFFSVDSLLTKMWATGKPSGQKKELQAAPGGAKKTIHTLRQENGVWKN